mmetsp:Transcript_13089/g.47039  ORF Transcript_13089/g.47039 Transcript_13089/m.47039 type:complete len:325 (-) Transcript_13089:5519-6493(-)
MNRECEADGGFRGEPLHVQRRLHDRLEGDDADGIRHREVFLESLRLSRAVRGVDFRPALVRGVRNHGTQFRLGPRDRRVLLRNLREHLQGGLDPGDEVIALLDVRLRLRGGLGGPRRGRGVDAAAVDARLRRVPPRERRGVDPLLDRLERLLILQLVRVELRALRKREQHLFRLVYRFDGVQVRGHADRGGDVVLDVVRLGDARGEFFRQRLVRHLGDGFECPRGVRVRGLLRRRAHSLDGDVHGGHDFVFLRLGDRGAVRAPGVRHLVHGALDGPSLRAHDGSDVVRERLRVETGEKRGRGDGRPRGGVHRARRRGGDLHLAS